MSVHLVVGGRGGIGKAVVKRLEAAGETCLVLDREDGHDAADPHVVGSFLAGSGPLASLILLAGSVGPGGLEDHGLDDWRRVIDDNLTTLFVCIRAALPYLKQNDEASIVILSSVNGRTGGNALSGPAYAAAKAGAIGLARNLARELGPVSIRVNTIAPGPVATPMVARLSEAELGGIVGQMLTGRVIDPEEIADIIIFLLSDAARSITGATIDVNGGMWMS